MDASSGHDTTGDQRKVRTSMRDQGLRVRRFWQLHRTRRAYDEAVPLCAREQQLIERSSRDASNPGEQQDHHEHGTVDDDYTRGTRGEQREREEPSSVHGPGRSDAETVAGEADLADWR